MEHGGWKRPDEERNKEGEKMEGEMSKGEKGETGEKGEVMGG